MVVASGTCTGHGRSRKRIRQPYRAALCTGLAATAAAAINGVGGRCSRSSLLSHTLSVQRPVGHTMRRVGPARSVSTGGGACSRREASQQDSLGVPDGVAQGLLQDAWQSSASSQIWQRFRLPLRVGSPGKPAQLSPEAVDDFWEAVDQEASLQRVETAVSSMLTSYQPIGCIMAVCAAVRHRWQCLQRKERPLILLALRQLWHLRAGASNLVAAALSAGSLPALGKAAGLTRHQVEAAFGSKVAWLLVELQQHAAVERTVRTSASGTEGTLSQGQVDLAMSLLTAQGTQRETSESLIMFLTHKAAELRLLSWLPDTGTVRGAAAMGCEVFAPLANLMGLGRIKDELEDAAFAITHSEERRKLRQLLGGPEGEALVSGAVRELQEALEDASEQLDPRLVGLTSLRVSGRAKSAFSTWKKMAKKGLKFEEVLDRAAIRVILDADSPPRAEELCFFVREVVANLWTLVAKREKDYIKKPKANGYRSLHLGIVRQGQPFEVQIRTEEMHRQAEYGACGHWDYKAGGKALALSHAAEGAGAELFAGIDADGDGCISERELQTALSQVGVQATADEVKAMLEVFDEDRDGAVDFKDFWKALVTTWFPLVSGTHRPRRRDTSEAG